ncbi:MAG: ABC transporter substrate-binding protein [Aminipila sp.]
MKKMFMKQISVIVLITILAGVFYGCGSSGNPNDGAEDGKTVVIGMPFFDENIDPANNYNGWGTIRYGIGETLVKIDENMSPQPWLASEYKMVDDNIWEFVIKDNVYFHDGEKMTAEHVKSSIERAIEKNTRAKDMLKDTLLSTDGNKLIIETATKDPILPDKLAESIFVIVNVNAADSQDFATKPICTGPYMVKEYNPKESAIMVPFDKYWGGKAKLESVKYILIADGNTRMLALQSGEIDATMNLTAAGLEVFGQDDNFVIDKTTSMKLIYIMMNPNNEFLSDRRVRDAINHAVDREAMAEVTLSKTVVPTQTPYPKTLPFGSEKIAGYNFDIEKSKQLLKDAGFADSDGDGILEKNGKKLSLKLCNYPTRSEIPIIAQYLQGELAKIGIEIELVGYEKLPVEQYQSGNFDLAFDGFSIATSTDPKRLLDVAFSETASENYIGYYKNDRVNEIVKLLETESNIQKRSELAYEAQKLIVEDGMNVFLCFSTNNIVRNKNLKNLYVHPLDYYQMNVDVDFNS